MVDSSPSNVYNTALLQLVCTYSQIYRATASEAGAATATGFAASAFGFLLLPHWTPTSCSPNEILTCFALAGAIFSMASLVATSSASALVLKFTNAQLVAGTGTMPRIAALPR